MEYYEYLEVYAGFIDFIFCYILVMFMFFLSKMFCIYSRLDLVYFIVEFFMFFFFVGWVEEFLVFRFIFFSIKFNNFI